MVHDDEPVGLDGSAGQIRRRAGRLGRRGDAGRDASLSASGSRRWRGGWCGCARDRPGAANAGRKVMALIFAMVLGADSIDDCDVLRAGRTRRLLGGWLPAPSTLGTFLRAFTFGHVRQLDALLGQALERAWKAGAGPGDGAAGDRCRQLRRRGLRPAEAGRLLRLHQAVGLPPDPRHPRGHARGAAHPAAQGISEHPEGDAALLRGADRACRASRRERREAAARRLRVLEHARSSSTSRRWAGSTRSACG